MHHPRATQFLPIFFTELLDSLPYCSYSIFLGDFNTVLDPALDRKDIDKPYHKPKTSRIINEYAFNNALVDPLRTANPLKSEYSWTNSRSASRIYYTLIPAHLYYKVT